MSDKFRRGGRFSTEQRKTSKETCIDCPACLACMTCTVTLRYCRVCRRTYLGIMDPDGGTVDTLILLDKKHARLCQQKMSGDQWNWICVDCLERRVRKERESAHKDTLSKCKSILLTGGYTGEDEW